MRLFARPFRSQSPIPVRYTFQGKSVSPALHWRGIPEDARELALSCLDPDAPTPKPVVHWLIYGLDPSLPGLPEGLPNRRELHEPVRALQGLNSFLYPGYVGPNPGFWDPAHRYRFRLYALSEPSGLGAGAGRGDFLAAIEGKVLQTTECVGTYRKTPLQRAKAVAFWAGLLGGIGGAIYVARQLGRSRASAREIGERLKSAA